ncbi:MAG: Hpt domain-containing protein [Cyclobacteriaceae bacterium]|mgnify:CR=1 FL=1
MGLGSEESPLEEAQPEELASEVKLINWSTLQTLEKYGGKELVAETLQEFEMEAEELLAEAAVGIKKNDYPQILSKLHTLKGNSGTLGLESISYYAKLIEGNLKQQDTTSLHQDFETLTAEFAKFRNTYKQSINQKDQQHVR